MSQEISHSPEGLSQKEKWLGQLAEFIIEANRKTWPADGAEVEPQRPGYKELEHASEDGRWQLRDTGTTTVYYDGKPTWTMAYGGHGQFEEFYPQAKETFNFLKKVLMQVTPDLPIRGPREYHEDDKRYSFEMLEGDLNDGLWKEEIYENGALTFRQTGIVGLVIHKDSNNQPIYPWQEA